MIRRRSNSAVWQQAMQVVDEICDWLEQHSGHRPLLNYSARNLEKLCRLHTWSLRYRLQVSDILDLLVPILRKGMAKSRKQRKADKRGLGVPVQLLVSDGSEKILQDQIAVQYPGGEHMHLWRERTRAAQLIEERREEAGGSTPIERRAATWQQCETREDLDQFVSNYAKRIELRREERERQILWRARRNYRWNPWR